MTGEWHQTWIEIAKLAIAYAFALPVGWHREKEAHSVGVRTFPLVAMASCAYLLLSAPQFQADVAAQSRVVQGVITGIGFIGGGAILKARGNIHGTATAASIWNTGALGVAVAQDRYYLAIALAALNLVALRVLLPLKEKLDARKSQ